MAPSKKKKSNVFDTVERDIEMMGNMCFPKFAKEIKLNPRQLSKRQTDEAKRLHNILKHSWFLSKKLRAAEKQCERLTNDITELNVEQNSNTQAFGMTLDRLSVTWNNNLQDLHGKIANLKIIEKKWQQQMEINNHLKALIPVAPYGNCCLQSKNLSVTPTQSTSKQETCEKKTPPTCENKTTPVGDNETLSTFRRETTPSPFAMEATPSTGDKTPSVVDNETPSTCEKTMPLTCEEETTPSACGIRTTPSTGETLSTFRRETTPSPFAMEATPSTGDKTPSVVDNETPSTCEKTMPLTCEEETTPSACGIETTPSTDEEEMPLTCEEENPPSAYDINTTLPAGEKTEERHLTSPFYSNEPENSSTNQEERELTEMEKISGFTKQGIDHLSNYQRISPPISSLDSFSDTEHVPNTNNTVNKITGVVNEGASTSSMMQTSNEQDCVNENETYKHSLQKYFSQITTPQSEEKYSCSAQSSFQCYDPLIECMSCNNVFYKSYMSEHVRIHHSNECFCLTCYVSFGSNKNMLYRHMMRVHLNDSLMSCGVCFNTFSTWNEYNMHSYNCMNW